MNFFNVVDALTYIIPGGIMLLVFRISAFIPGVGDLLRFEDAPVTLASYVVGSFLIGFVLHYPAVLCGRIIVKGLGAPVSCLLELDRKKCRGLLRRFRSDYGREYKEKLVIALREYWHCEGDSGRGFGASRYYALCEALIEEKCPKAWNIHERFYLSANLARGMIIPSSAVAVSMWPHSRVLAVAISLGTVVFAVRYYQLLISATKQIFDAFYAHHVNRTVQPPRGETASAC